MIKSLILLAASPVALLVSVLESMDDVWDTGDPLLYDDANGNLAKPSWQ